MDLVSPINRQAEKDRNHLIAECLRPDAQTFKVEHEYPIVLSTQGSKFSYCYSLGGTLAAHANLWPREMTNPNQKFYCKVGLVGNVATQSRFRGQGLMRQLLDQLEQRAKEQDISALILWSDLSSFYHKLGYKSLGQEVRYHFEFDAKIAKIHDFYCVDPKPLTENQCQQLLNLRPKTHLTLRRSIPEFRQLLNIPALGLFVSFSGEQIDSFAICGKGADMVGVVHEWGGDPQLVHIALHTIMARLQTQFLSLLSPAEFMPMERGCYSKERHAMALSKKIDAQCELENSFIWGLDSI